MFHTNLQTVPEFTTHALPLTKAVHFGR